MVTELEFPKSKKMPKPKFYKLYRKHDQIANIQLVLKIIHGHHEYFMIVLFLFKQLIKLLTLQFDIMKQTRQESAVLNPCSDLFLGRCLTWAFPIFLLLPFPLFFPFSLYLLPSLSYFLSCLPFYSFSNFLLLFPGVQHQRTGQPGEGTGGILSLPHLRLLRYWQWGKTKSLSNVSTFITYQQCLVCLTIQHLSIILLCKHVIIKVKNAANCQIFRAVCWLGQTS